MSTNITINNWILVEDEPDLYDILTQYYDFGRGKPIAFTSGEDAVNWIDAIDKDELTVDLPRFALIDLRLPGPIDGALVSLRIRRSKRLKGIPIIIMTAYRLSPQERSEVMIVSRADTLVFKPLPSLENLRAHIEE
ncbi:MAG: response regulator, partial [Anaerolineae bacterium]|nr:response regulator [Anaerolineae bacterium]